MAMSKCQSCGFDFNDQGTGVCVACDARIASLEKPQNLKDMEWVYEGKPADTPGQVREEAALKDDHWKFKAALTAAQNGYRAHLRGMEKTKGPGASDSASEPQAVDEGSERAEELYLKILAQARKDAGLGPLEEQ